MTRAGDLPSESYSKGFLALEIFPRLGILLSFVLVFGVGLLGFFGSLMAPWTAFDHGIRLKWFIVFLAFLMAWPFSTYGYNFFFAQGHYPDRTLLLVLLALVCWRPVFIFPFLLLVFAIMGQLTEPVPTGTILEHKLQVLRVLNLFAAWFLIHAVTDSKRTDVFLLLTCCLVAAAYWLPALAKLKLNWLMHGQIYHLPLTAYGHGWLGNLEPEQVVSFAQFLAWFDWPMRIFVIGFEAAFIFFLLSRSISLILLAAIILFHVGVFVLMGFFFWTWILLDVALLLLLWADRTKKEYKIYGTGYIVLSVMLVLTSQLWARPPQLGWYDTRLGYMYRVEGITASGDRYRLPPRFFAPYEDVFSMATFSFLVKDHAVLSGPYGVTQDPAIARALMPPMNVEQLLELEQEFEGRGYHAIRSKRLEDFMVQYIANRNAGMDRAFFPGMAMSPPQFWTQVDDAIFAVRDPIREVVITEYTSLYDDKTLEVIRKLEVARFPIPANPR